MFNRINTAAQKGFTLIEAVIVIVILGILIAIAIPKFTDLTTQSAVAASRANQNAVVTGFAIYLGENDGAYPTMTQLVSQLQVGGASVSAGTTGINFTISSTLYTVATYTDTDCTAATASGASEVKCVGTVSAA
jgi:MSHA pilin protein MshA